MSLGQGANGRNGSKADRRPQCPLRVESGHSVSAPLPADEADFDALASCPIEDATYLLLSQVFGIWMLLAESELPICAYSPFDFLGRDAAANQGLPRLVFGGALLGKQKGQQEA